MEGKADLPRNGRKELVENRGITDHFIIKVEVLDKNMASIFLNKNQQVTGHVTDTVYVLIDKDDLKNRQLEKKR